MVLPGVHAGEHSAEDISGIMSILRICYVGGEDLSERIVREGWALDYRKYSTNYLQTGAEAKRAGAGI